ncbi:hypothetical protein GTO27_04195, partial [Candidatus Bathyarchaeota archaeon]|nr:hypothetical protein [Candidatus Bathyarchaeota archaeon]
TEEISQIDAEIEHIFKETGITKASCFNYSATLSTEIKYQVTDKDKVLDFIKKHPTALKLDILNSKEMNRLYKDGVVPNPEKDGIKC